MTERNKPQLTQLDWLAVDIDEHVRLMLENTELFAVLGDSTDPDRHNYFEVLIDLYLRVFFNAQGLRALLSENLRDPSLAVMRALFEACVNLGYLANHPAGQDEAVVLRAYSYLKQIDLFEDSDDFVRERQAILARMPAHLVKLAKERIRKRQNWTGKNVRDTAKAAQMGGYEAYRYMSEEVHGRVAGDRIVRRTEDGVHGTVILQNKLRPGEDELIANTARRLLDSSFRLIWKELDGGPLTYRTSNPHDWILKQRGQGSDERGPADPSPMGTDTPTSIGVK